MDVERSFSSFKRLIDRHRDEYEMAREMVKSERDEALRKLNQIDELIQIAESIGVWEDTISELKRQRSWFEGDYRRWTKAVQLVIWGFNSKLGDDDTKTES